MEDYGNVTLVKITKERVVTIDGEKFLAVDTEIFNRLKKTHIPRKYVDSAPMQKAILETLKKHPGIRRSVIMSHLVEEYNMEPDLETLRACMQRMKYHGKLYTKGERVNAVWYVKKGS